MMNFFLGMGTMWIIISVAFFLLDCFKLDLWESDRANLKLLFFPVYLIATFCENWYGFVRVIKTLDLSLKYKINPFNTCISEIDEKFSDEDKEIFIKRVADSEQVERQWRKVLHLKTLPREKMQ
jgi:hypothetical protein